MGMLYGGMGERSNQIVPYGDNLTIDARPGLPSGYGGGEQPESHPIEVGKLVARYSLLLVILMIVGAAGGFVSVVLSSPMFRARLLIEVQGTTAFKDGIIGGASAESNEIDIQT